MYYHDLRSQHSIELIHDNLKKEIFYIINIFNDEKIINYQRKFNEIKSELFKLSIQSSIKNLSSSKDKTIREIKVKSNTSKNKFLKITNLIKDIQYPFMGFFFSRFSVTRSSRKTVSL